MSRRWPLWVELTVVFVLVAGLALTGGGFLLLKRVERQSLAEQAETVLGQGAIVAHRVSVWHRAPGTDTLPLILYRFHQETGIRPVYVDRTHTALADSWDPSPLAGQTLSHPELARALAGEASTGVRRLPGGARVMYGAVPVRQNGEIAGALLLSADLAPVDSALWELTQQLLLAALAAGVVAVALALGFARTLSAPLVRLSQAAGALAGGRLETRVQPGGSLELRDLGESFNQMADDLGRLDRQRRAFVADASHELRTPVAAIRALAEPLLTDTRGDLALYKEHLSDIVHECDRSARLVERLLDLARLDARQELSAAPAEAVDLSEALSAVVHELQPLARKRNVSLELDAPPVGARLDVRLLEAVVGNLVENAVKYTPAGGQVRVSVTPGDREAVIRVSDTGRGIPPEHLPHIFERFYRVDKARARATGGTGLGLAIASEAAALLGGRISVSSEVGKGSTFTFTLPM